jgi:hypothetical protein
MDVTFSSYSGQNEWGRQCAGSFERISIMAALRFLSGRSIVARPRSFAVSWSSAVRDSVQFDVPSLFRIYLLTHLNPTYPGVGFTCKHPRVITVHVHVLIACPFNERQFGDAEADHGGFVAQGWIREPWVNKKTKKWKTKLSSPLFLRAIWLVFDHLRCLALLLHFLHSGTTAMFVKSEWERNSNRKELWPTIRPRSPTIGAFDWLLGKHISRMHSDILTFSFDAVA